VKNAGVVMPTRDRFFRLEQCLPSWIEQGLPVLLVTEPDQVGAHRGFLSDHGWTKKVGVASQGTGGAGIGYA
jgi:hypothetical protein